MPFARALRNSVWQTWINEQHTCWCCHVEPITVGNYHCGHIISRSHGGEPRLNNLRPICALCNSSMGTTDMRQFINDNGLWDYSTMPTKMPIPTPMIIPTIIPTMPEPEAELLEVDEYYLTITEDAQAAAKAKAKAKAFPCRMRNCKKEYTTKSSLNNHYKQKHPNKVDCDYPGCNRVLLRGSLSSHKLAMHPKPPTSKPPAYSDTPDGCIRQTVTTCDPDCCAIKLENLIKEMQIILGGLRFCECSRFFDEYKK